MKIHTFINRFIVFPACICILVGCAAKTSGLFYNSDRVEEIHVGMDAREAVEILGPPYVIEPYIGGEKWIWAFSTSKNDDAFTISIENGKIKSLSGYREGKK